MLVENIRKIFHTLGINVNIFGFGNVFTPSFSFYISLQIYIHLVHVFYSHSNKFENMITFHLSSYTERHVCTSV